MGFRNQVTAWLLLAGFTTLLHAQPVPAETRGELPYSTQCITCHTTQMH